MKTVSALKMTLFLTTLAFAQAIPARAQTAGNWNFNNTLAGTAGTNITVTSASFGSAIGSSSYNGEYFGQDGWPAGGLNSNAYLQVSLAPASSYYLVLNSVTLIIRHSTTGTAAGSGPMTWSLRSSLDGYTSDISTGTLSTTYATFTVPLSTSFQSLTSAVTFRLYGYNSVTTSGGFNRFVYSNISVKGQAISSLLAQQDIVLSSQMASSGVVGLKWSASGFGAGTDFVVERSTDGSSFTPIHSLQSTSGSDASYAYQDASAPPAAAIYYRIIARGPDGSVFRSPILVVNIDAASALQIQGIVAGPSSLRANMKLPADGTYRLSMYTMDGKAILKQAIGGASGSLVIDIPFGDHSHGVYVLTLSDGTRNISRQFFY